MSKIIQNDQNKILKEYYSTSVYLSSNYQQYIKSKYLIENKDIYLNQKVLLLLYAFEWFNISKNDISSKLKYHPYLKREDYNKFEKEHNRVKKITSLITIMTFTSSTAYLLNKLKDKNSVNLTYLMIKGFFITSLSFLMCKIYFKSQLSNYIQLDPSLNQYMKLDISRDMIRSDLIKLGINFEDEFKLADNLISNITGK